MAIPAAANRVLYLTASATTTLLSADTTSWANAKRGAGTLTNYPMTGTLTVQAHRRSGTTQYKILRSIVWFNTPELFGNIDEDIVLRLRGSGSAGITVVKCDLTASEPITATDGAAGYAPYLWDTIKSNVLFSTAVSSSLTSSAYTDITLNEEAKKWILSGSEWLRQTTTDNRGYGFALGVVNYLYDYSNTEPPNGMPLYGPQAHLATTGTHPTFGPSNTLNGTWLTGSRGAEPKYTLHPTYVINPYDNNITQYPRRVPQTPYGLSIKGPASLRGKNVPYKVTS